MAFPVTINGRTYTLADFSGQNYVSGFPDALEDFATAAESAVTDSEAAQTAAEAAQTAAETAQAAAEAAQEAIDGLYLGAQASDPTVDLNGSPVTSGDWYFNTADSTTRVYDGSAWNVINPDLSGDASPTLGGDLDGAGYDISNVTDVTIAGDLTVDTNTLVVDSTNNRVGIGETDPQAKLHIDAGSTDIPFCFDSNTQAYPASGFGGALTYNHTAGSARVNFWNTWTSATGSQGGFDFRRLTGASSSDSLMTINGDGNVGIGTDPVAHLTVDAGSSPDSIYGVANFGADSGSNSYVTVSRGGNNAGGIKILRGSVVDLSIYVNSAEASVINYNGGDTNDGLFFKSGSAATDVMTLDSSGNVGIGETSPLLPLHIKKVGASGTVLLESQNSSGTLRGHAAVIAGTGSCGIVRTDGKDFNFWTQPIADKGTETNLSADMTIDSSGNLLVGTTSQAGRFTVKGSTSDSSANSATFQNSGGSSVFRIRNDGLLVSSGANSLYNFATSGRDVYVNSSGVMGYLSSVRDSKLNIQSLDDISWLYQLNTVSFNYKAKDENGEYTGEAEQETEYGLIAEEVEEVNSDLCFYNVDENGSQVLAGVTYRKLIPALTKAIQEQQAMIETLQAEVAALKGE